MERQSSAREAARGPCRQWDTKVDAHAFCSRFEKHTSVRFAITPMVAKKDSFKERLGRVRERVARRVRDTATKVLDQMPTTSLVETKHRDEMETLTGEPPVVARLM